MRIRQRCPCPTTRDHRLPSAGNRNCSNSSNRGRQNDVWMSCRRNAGHNSDVTAGQSSSVLPPCFRALRAPASRLRGPSLATICSTNMDVHIRLEAHDCAALKTTPAMPNLCSRIWRALPTETASRQGRVMPSSMPHVMRVNHSLLCTYSLSNIGPWHDIMFISQISCGSG